MPTADDYAARTRAARGHADLDQQSLAERLNISVRTLARIESGERAPSLEERQAVARECDVPAMFMEVGFAPLDTPVSDTDLRVTELAEQFSVLRAAVVEMAVGNLQDARVLLGQVEEDHSQGPSGPAR